MQLRTFPPSTKVEAKVMTYNPASVKMAVYKGDNIIDTKSAGTDQNKVYPLSVESQDI
jgi:hypothetical protein